MCRVGNDRPNCSSLVFGTKALLRWFSLNEGTSHLIAKVLGVSSTHYLTVCWLTVWPGRTNSQGTIPQTSKKTIIITFTLALACLPFSVLGSWESSTGLTLDWFLGHTCNTNSHHLKRFSSKSLDWYQSLFSSPYTNSIDYFFWSCLRMERTNFAATHLISKSSIKICCHELEHTPLSSVMSLILKGRSLLIFWWIFFNVLIVLRCWSAPRKSMFFKFHFTTFKVLIPLKNLSAAHSILLERLLKHLISFYCQFFK